MLNEEQMKLMNSHNAKINPANWVVCWEDENVLEIVNNRHRRIKFEKPVKKKRKRHK